MQFSGWWVSGDRDRVTITAAVFDETELSAATGWKQTHQNDDDDMPHGFLEFDAVCRDVQNRLKPALESKGNSLTQKGTSDER